MLAAARRAGQGRIEGHGRSEPGRGARLPGAGRPPGAADRSATAGWPRHRIDSRDKATISESCDDNTKNKQASVRPASARVAFTGTPAVRYFHTSRFGLDRTMG